MRSISVIVVRHSTKNRIAQKEHLVSSPLLVTRLHVSHAVVERLHNGVVVLTAETADVIFRLFIRKSWSADCPARVSSHGCCPVRATGVYYRVDVIYLLSEKGIKMGPGS